MTTPDENPDGPAEAQGRTPHAELPAEGADLVDGGPTQAEPSEEGRAAAQTTSARDEQPEDSGG